MTARRLESLDEIHNLSGFFSGPAPLDSWLTDHALASQYMDSARTFVLIDADTVAGFFSLTIGSVRRADAPAELVRGLPAYRVGIVLLARLAVCADRHGMGLGSLLLAETLAVADTEGPARDTRSIAGAGGVKWYARLDLGPRIHPRRPRQPPGRRSTRRAGASRA